MCIKCEIKKGLLELAGVEEKEVVVGEATLETVKELHKAEDAVKALKVEIDERLEAAAIAVYEEMKPKTEEADDNFTHAWNMALQSAGVDVNKQAADYSINKENGQVTRTEIVKQEQATDVEVAEGTH